MFLFASAFFFFVAGCITVERVAVAKPHSVPGKIFSHLHALGKSAVAVKN